jgi:tRNA-splicing ligase RtcB
LKEYFQRLFNHKGGVSKTTTAFSLGGRLDSGRSRASLYSTIHGAARVMSRSEAKRTFTRHQMEARLKDWGVILLGGDIDESPMAYRRLDDALQHHEGTIKVVHRLRPFGVLMASSNDRKRDPHHE